MNAIRRINPRRPYTLTAEGLKRIVGQSARGRRDASTPPGAASAAAPAARRPPCAACSRWPTANAARCRRARARPSRRRRCWHRRTRPCTCWCSAMPRRSGHAGSGYADPGASARRPCARSSLAPCWRKSPAIRRCTSSCPTRIPTTPTWAAAAHTGYGGDGRGLAERRRSLAWRPGAARPLPPPASCCWPPMPSTRPCPGWPCAARSRPQAPSRYREQARFKLDAAELALEEPT